MQIEVPPEYPYPTMFLLGNRVDSSGAPEPVGTVLVKGTFQNLDEPIAVAKERQVPIFVSDVPFLVPNGDFEYEHDLVPFKPSADVIILGAAKPPDESATNPTGIWYVVLKTSTGQQFEKKFDASQIKRFPTKTIFGWASRGEGERLVQAGKDLENFYPRDPPEPDYPPQRALPKDFKNHFYNGYDRTVFGISPHLEHLADGTGLTICSERRPPNTPASESFSVQLPTSRPTATLTVLIDSNQKEIRPISLALDTVIIEPELDRYLVVWRGIWQWDDANRDRYLKLSIQGGT
jgi:hypothetical protein